MSNQGAFEREDMLELLRISVRTYDAASATFALAELARLEGVTKTANAAGVNRSHLSKICQRTTAMNLTTFMAVAKALGIDLYARPAIYDRNEMS